jgi:predicted dithiol-disulfide oxidoreductase (DUF899 family)
MDFAPSSDRHRKREGVEHEHEGDPQIRGAVERVESLDVLINYRRAGCAAGRVIRPEHEVVDEQLAAAVEQLRLSTGARGVEFLMGYYPILDRAPKGRDEDDGFQLWIRPHDEYNSK